MTPASLRALCDSLNDKNGTGGQTRLARLLKWDARTVRNKLSGSTRITHSNELAIRKALEEAGISGCGPSGRIDGGF